MAINTRGKILVCFLILVSAVTACQVEQAPELTLTKPPSSLISTAKPSQTPVPTPTFIPLPTPMPQTESNCPSNGWTLYNEENGLSGNVVEILAIDRLGGIWVGFDDSSLNRMSNGKWFTLQKSFASGIINAILPLDDGSVWLGTQGGVGSYYKDQVWEDFILKPGGKPTSIYAVGVSSVGEVFLGSWNGLFTLVDREFVGFLKPVPPDYQFAVKSITFDQDGGMWVGAKYNIHYYKDGIWGTFERTGEPYYDIVDIEELQNGEMWFATMDGVYTYDGRKWQPNSPEIYNSEGDRVRVTVYSLAQSPDGRIWIVVKGNNGKEIQVYENGSWKPMELGGGDPEAKPRWVEVDSWGAVWFGTSQGVLCYNP